MTMAVAGLSAAAQSAQSAPGMPWLVTGNVVFQMMDHETFGPNTRCTHNNPIVNEGTGQLPQDFWYFGKCGGEVRAEIHYRMWGNSDGSVTVGPGEVILFEGTSAETNDRDGGFKFGGFVSPNIHIQKGQSVTRTFHVSNVSEDVPDDKADITMTWLNH
ncbi:hypothetical protein ACFXPI_07190 [Streptomyces sp. NPDC059104]|uniref:hypothetical protein n=1 Tax=Streptomyces sp. NPDC059104 TaxID=3346729 RepID=UPI0036B5514F